MASAKMCFYATGLQSRLTKVSREAKKKQRSLSELFTRNTTKKLKNTLVKPLSPNNVLTTHLESTNQQWWKSALLFSIASLMALVHIPMSKNHPCSIYTKHYNIITIFNLYRINIFNDEALPFVFAQ